MRRVANAVPLLAVGAAWLLLAAGGAEATTIERLSDEALIDRSERIVHGHVVSRSVRRDPACGRLYTEYRFQVVEMLKGDPEIEVAFREWGGEKDGQRLWIPGAGELEEGQEVLVFLGPVDEQSGCGFTTGLAQGKLIVRRSGDRPVVSRTMAALNLVDEEGREVTAPSTEPDLESWKQKIRERVTRPQPPR